MQRWVSRQTNRGKWPDGRRVGRVLVLLAVCILGMVGCSDRGPTPEDQIRALIAAGEQAAEAKDILALRDRVSSKYRDRDGRDKRELLGVITGYFLRHESIHLVTRIDEIHLEGPDRAQVSFYLGAAGQAVSDFDALASLRADIYRIELVVVREEGDWRALSAQWSRAQGGQVIQELL